MREIKFRGKRKDNGEWVYGKLIKSNFETLITQMVNATYVDGRMLTTLNVLAYAVIPETVGQFTGVFDLNGIEIYESDITNTGYQIVWSIDKEGAAGFDLQSNTRGSYYPLLNGHKVEIVGNKFDNPELLERG